MAEDVNPPTWTALTLQNSWTNYGGGSPSARYFVDNAGDVHLSGVIAGGTNSIIAQLPTGAYDTTNSQMYTLAASGTAGTAMARIDVTLAGAITLMGYSGGGANSWVSLDGVVIANPNGVWGNPVLANAWINYGATYLPFQFCVNKNGIVAVRGLIKNGTTTANTAIVAAPGLLQGPMFELPMLGGANPMAAARLDPVQGGAYNFLGFYNSGGNIYTSAAGRWFAEAEGAASGPTGPAGAQGPAGPSTGAAPTGTLMPFAGNPATPPSGWLTCDGSAVSRTTYSALFTALGVTYGTGDGSTTFNVPDMRGRVIAGYDTTQTEFNAVGGTGGEKTHVLSSGEMPAHSHGVTFRSGSLAQTTQTGAADGAVSNRWHLAVGTNDWGTTNTGGGAAHNNLQPYLTLPYIIKT
jgi:microcystin-dependent protein